MGYYDDFYDFYDFYGSTGVRFDDVLAGLIGAALAILAVALLVALAFYVLQSMSMYSIAKRRGIHHPGLAWVPIANYWMMGCISDQYQYVTKGKVKNRRTVMLTLSIVSVLLSCVTVSLGSLIPGFGIPLWIAECVVSYTLLVFWYLALYDLYASCNPDSSVLFLVLSIVLAVTRPFLMLSCRKKDGGMPPRKNAQPESSPAPETQWEPTPPCPEPWEENHEE